jgi:hypothetical protein
MALPIGNKSYSVIDDDMGPLQASVSLRGRSICILNI